MLLVDPAEVFQGTVLVVVPHMDDGVLACGGTIAKLPHKEQIHVVYATDGFKSPAPAFPWSRATLTDLGVTRMDEARAALGVLGVPQRNIHFLGFPDGELKHHAEELCQKISKIAARLSPAYVLIPFRFDRHPDHLALNRSATDALRQETCEAELMEYFVYYRWRLLRSRDVRKYIRSEHMIEVDTEAESATKRKALECFRTQTTRFYAWQDRPILTTSLLDEVCREPEYFLKSDPLFPDASIFASAHTWIRLTHWVEPPLKRRKDQLTALLRGGARKDGKGEK